VKAAGKQGVARAVLAGAVLAAVVAGLAGAARVLEKPKTVVQVVTIKWGAEATPELRRAALEELEKAAATVPGVRSLWLRAIRVQPRDFMTAYAIEFEDLGAAERFSTSPAYEQWKKRFLAYIEESRTQQVSN
jgi:antibiotic biosynthesis monooxygenase (ABM) superfamily enzyme